MSQIYTLELGTPSTPPDQVDQYLRAITESAGLVESVSSMGHVLILHSGLVVSGALARPAGGEQIHQDFGIERSTNLDLQPNSRREPDPQVHDVVMLVMQLLGRIPDEAVLHLDYYQVWLVRQGGQLWLSDNDALWEPDLLALVPPPYQRVPLAFSDVV